MPRLRAEDARQRLEGERAPEFSEALARGLRVLDAFGPDRQQMTLSDIARAVDLPRATARRALITLEQLGYMESDGRLFRLTAKVLELAAAYLASNSISTVFQPVCEQISRQIGEACSAAVLDGPDVVMVAHASPRRFIAVGPGVGFRLPAWCTALGRVLLAALPDEDLETFLTRLAPEPLTPFTLTDVERLRTSIVEVRRQNYAFVDQEAEAGFRSIAVPVRRHDGRVVAALNVGARIETGSLDVFRQDYLPMLRSAAETAGGRLIG